jgi:hypothetical protein
MDKFTIKRCGKYQKGCNECNEKCKEMQQLRKGEFICQFVSDENIRCEYKFGTNGKLQRHIKTVHLGERNFECSECEYKAGTNSKLQRHIKICTGKENISSGEHKLRRILDEMQVEWSSGSYELRNPKTNHLLLWDIIIDCFNNRLFIEYDGRQHFKPVCFGGMSQEKAEDEYKNTQYRDNLKNEYCKENDYKMLRIPYNQYENIEALVVDFIRTNTE